MHTYGPRINPAELCLELREAHEQNYAIFPPVAYRCVVCCIWSFRDVGLDITQRFELVFLNFSVFHGYQKKEGNAIPGSPSTHFGEVEVPVYLTNLTEMYCAEICFKPKLCRISLSSRTLVPYEAIGFSLKR